MRLSRSSAVSLLVTCAVMCVGACVVACSHGGSAIAGPTSGDAGDGGAGGRTPAVHRAIAEACPTTAPPQDCAGGCVTDCTDGKNGRCMQGAHTCACRFDECFTDADCAAGTVCSCRTLRRDARGSNLCIPAGCRTDADCGAGGWCSPTYDLVCGPGPESGIAGWYCHTKADTCTDDADCKDGGATGYCAWYADKKRWACGYASCI